MQKKIFGLVGKNISYSFSKNYFNTFFVQNNLTDCIYENFDIQNIDEFHSLIKKNNKIAGLNITIPYKESIIPYLDKISKKALKIGAVNVIRITKKGKLKGYNSDYYGFKKSLKPLLQTHHKKALILGTGGASKAVAYALKELKIKPVFVSRNGKKNSIGYNEINAEKFKEHHIIINCSPVGTSPNVDACPDIPYEFFTNQHLAYDLIYNPEETLFLKKAKKHQAQIKNGYEMLVFQAEKAWEIWNKQ